MTDSRWKRRERQTARLMGAERIPNSGHGQADIVTGRYSIEHKSRAGLPDWLTDALDQAVRNAVAGTTPVVIVTAPGARRRLRRVVLMRFEDWRTGC
jgi:hypothetical protein